MVFSDCLPIIDCLRAARLQGSIGIPTNSSVKHKLFVISAYITAECSNEMQRDEFFGELVTLVGKHKGSDNLVAAGDFDAQVSKLLCITILFGGHCVLFLGLRITGLASPILCR